MRLKLVLVIVACFTLGAFVAFATLTYRAPTPGSVIDASGLVEVGGPFTLIDHTGREVTDQDFRGRLMLVYFGFTYCPDVCPSELQVMADALDALGDKAARVTPIFITVDPERDTVAQMRAYVQHFHDRLVGLTGTPDQVRAAAKAYRVYYRKVEDEKSEGGYTIDHTSIVYLMNAEGAYVAHFSYGTSPQAMADAIAQHL